LSNHETNNMNIEIRDGHVFKDGEAIGTLDVSTVTLSKNIGPTVKAAIKRETGDDSIKFEIAVDEPETATTTTATTANWQAMPSHSVGDVFTTATGAVQVTEATAAPMSDAELLAELQKRGLAPKPEKTGIPEEPQFNARILNKQEIVAKLSAIEAPPATLPDMGDKTPAFVDWARRHATPEEFAILYPAHRKQPSLAERDAGEEVRIAKLQKLPSETTDKKGDAE